jgi:hypothetical protein
MQGFNRWAAISLAMVAVLMAVGIGAGAYQAGVAHGLALQIPAGTTPEAAAPYYYYGYGWHRPGGSGFSSRSFLSSLARRASRDLRGRPSPVALLPPWDEMPSRFDEWHRRAHEQMRPDASSPTHL